MIADDAERLSRKLDVIDHFADLADPRQALLYPLHQMSDLADQIRQGTLRWTSAVCKTPGAGIDRASPNRPVRAGLSPRSLSFPGRVIRLGLLFFEPV